MQDIIIDISHHNGSNLDFAAAANSGIEAIIHKASQGTTGVDEMYAANKPAILAAGLFFGSYHFGDGTDGGSQALHYLQTIGASPNELLVLDFEHNPAGPSMTLVEAHAFINTIFQRVGKFPVLYAGAFLKDMLKGYPDPVLAQCPLWLAQFGPVPALPPGWSRVSLWQYTDGATPPNAQAVPGIGYCDRDKYNDDNGTSLTDFWVSACA